MQPLWIQTTNIKVKNMINKEMTQHMEQRVLVLFDVQNMYYSAKHLYNKKVDFRNILNTGVAKRKLVRAIAYVIKTDIKEESVFHEALENIGIEVKAKDIQIFYGGDKKGDWDIGIAMDAVRMAPKVDTVVLVSGDGDFRELVLYLQGHGVRVEAMAFKETASNRLKSVVDSFTDLSSDRKLFLLGFTGKKPANNYSTNNRSGSNKPTANKPSNNTSANNKSGGNATTTNKPSDNTPTDNKSGGNATTTNKSSNSTQANNKSGSNKPTANKPFNNTSANNKSGRNASTINKSSGGTSTNDNSESNKPASNKPKQPAKKAAPKKQLKKPTARKTDTRSAKVFTPPKAQIESDSGEGDAYYIDD
jgi:uncharacterized LabA/DUF88 family protein